MFMKSVRASILAGLTLWASGVDAAPMSPDPTGMWYDPAQPGWGMSITQQGETIFVALFSYDANHNPQWFVASNVVDTGTFVNFLVGEAYAGTLYQTTGPDGFKATPVGTMQIAYVQPTNDLSVTYTINGVSTNKVLTPQTWGSNAAQLVGKYAGTAFINGVIINGTVCDAPAPLKNITAFSIDPGSTPESIIVTWGSGIDVACSMAGTYSQRGQMGSLTGPVMCGPVTAPHTNVGSFTITEMTIGAVGFSGYLVYQSPVVDGGTCGVGGTFGGVRR
jgi:hypothetical protein